MPTRITSLPPEIHFLIASYLPLNTLISLLRTSNSLNNLYLPAFHTSAAHILRCFRSSSRPLPFFFIATNQTQNREYQSMFDFGGRLKNWLIRESPAAQVELFFRCYGWSDVQFVGEIVVGLLQYGRGQAVKRCDHEECQAKAVNEECVGREWLGRYTSGDGTGTRMAVLKQILRETCTALNVSAKERWALIEVLVDLADVEVAELFLRAGLNFGNTPRVVGEMGAQDGVWPLHYAVRRGRLVKFLVEKGADVNARNDAGRTPLEELGGRGRLAEILEDPEEAHHKVVRYLVEQGAVVGVEEVPAERLVGLVEESVGDAVMSIQGEDVKMDSQ